MLAMDQSSALLPAAAGFAEVDDADDREATVRETTGELVTLLAQRQAGAQCTADRTERHHRGRARSVEVQLRPHGDRIRTDLRRHARRRGRAGDASHDELA
ncbi:MAG TPA: hypothetical protein PL082_03090, partial [Tepidiformaceae bacterium]|nr:hypothetical protein [Tepidiformaceae bacterium]